MPSTFAQRLIEAREEAKLSQKDLATRSGVKQSTISYIESGRNKSSKRTPALARALGVSANWLSDGIGAKRPKTQRAERDESGEYIAVRRATIKLSAGVSGFAIEYEDGESPPLFFRSEWFTTRRFDPLKLVALRVHGSSMEPGLYDSDTVVINLNDTRPADGEVFAVNYEGELVIKRMKRDGGEWWLSSDNTEKRRFSDKRVSEDVHLLGRVVYKSSERI